MVAKPDRKISFADNSTRLLHSESTKTGRRLRAVGWPSYKVGSTLFITSPDQIVEFETREHLASLSPVWRPASSLSYLETFKNHMLPFMCWCLAELGSRHFVIASIASLFLWPAGMLSVRGRGSPW